MENWQPHIRLYLGTRYCGIYECLTHDPSVLSPPRLSGRSRPGTLHVGTISYLLLPICSGRTFRTIDLASNNFHADDRPFSNSLNSKKCLLARLLGILSLMKSSYSRNVNVTFMKVPLCAGLYRAHFQILRIGTELR